MNLMNYVSQILNFYNFYDGAIMVDRAGKIAYYHNKRSDINTLTENQIVGKSIFEVYPEVTFGNSTLMEVIRTGQILANKYQELVNYKGEKYSAICNTMPIYNDEKIIGAIEIFLYFEEQEKFKNIFLQSKNERDTQEPAALSDIISNSEEMEKLKEKIAKVAETKSSVLIYGETGTGKELVARAIHSIGPRSEKRFISQNCAAIPENLLESILFGTVKGSFTGAENRKGLFEIASGGTLFLDEINSMDKAVQAKILKAVEEQKIIHIGGTTEIPVDVRIIAASNKNPRDCVEEGTLREDLYYRLRVVQLNLPPLRKRKKDIEAIVNYYIKFYNRTIGKKVKGVDAEVMAKFMDYQWPGNIRELRNMIEGGFNLCEGEYLGLKDLDIYSMRALTSDNNEMIELEHEEESLKEKTKNFERRILVKVISESESLTKAAEKMGITRQTLNNKIKEHKISSSELDKGI